MKTPLETIAGAWKYLTSAVARGIQRVSDGDRSVPKEIWEQVAQHLPRLQESTSFEDDDVSPVRTELLPQDRLVSAFRNLEGEAEIYFRAARNEKNFEESRHKFPPFEFIKDINGGIQVARIWPQSFKGLKWNEELQSRGVILIKSDSDESLNMENILDRDLIVAIAADGEDGSTNFLVTFDFAKGIIYMGSGLEEYTAISANKLSRTITPIRCIGSILNIDDYILKITRLADLCDLMNKALHTEYLQTSKNVNG